MILVHLKQANRVYHHCKNSNCKKSNKNIWKNGGFHKNNPNKCLCWNLKKIEKEKKKPSNLQLKKNMINCWSKNKKFKTIKIENLYVYL